MTNVTQDSNMTNNGTQNVSQVNMNEDKNQSLIEQEADKGKN